MINERLIWTRQICEELLALRKGVGISYAEGDDPLAKLQAEWQRGSFTEGDDYPTYDTPIVERLRFLERRYEGYAYTGQAISEAANEIEALRRKVEELTTQLQITSDGMMPLAERNAELRRQLAAMQQERDHWREANRTTLAAGDILKEQLAAAQAREAQLREALEMARNGIQWYIENSIEANGCDDEAVTQIDNALATQPDHSTLDKRLKELIEKSITIIQNDSWAMTFQSMGQYRTALINEIKNLK